MGKENVMLCVLKWTSNDLLHQSFQIVYFLLKTIFTSRYKRSLIQHNNCTSSYQIIFIQPYIIFMMDITLTWWSHQMETFSALLAICAGNSPVPGEFPTQRPVTRSFGVFFDLRLNKRLSKQWWGWWFETLSRPLWRHRNETGKLKKY